MRTRGGLEVPDDLASVLERDAGILAMWERLCPSCQRKHVSAVVEAKRPETRTRRIAAAVRDTLAWNERHKPSEKTDSR